MSVTSGFYNSLNGDRRYDSEQMSAIFDGIINDGVFASIGEVFTVKANGGTNITVDTGFAWFNSKWIRNDGILPMVLDASEMVLDRIDAIIFDIDRSNAVRNGTIKFIKGTPASSPQRPEMADTDDHHQYPIAFVYRKADSSEISQADITNMVGTSSCPYITGILEVHNIDNIVAQWKAEWNEWFQNAVQKADTETSLWISQVQAEFETWFDSLQVILEGDVATKFAEQIVELYGKFDTLARERCVYSTIEDSVSDTLLDSNGLPIDGRTVMSSSGGSDGGVADYAARADHAMTAERAVEADNSESANRLSTARKIGSASFDGTKDITLQDMGAEPAFTKNNAFNKNFGSAAGTVCQGNDSRLSNARRASNITMSLSGTTLSITYS